MKLTLVYRDILEDKVKTQLLGDESLGHYNAWPLLELAELKLLLDPEEYRTESIPSGY